MIQWTYIVYVYIGHFSIMVGYVIFVDGAGFHIVTEVFIECRVQIFGWAIKLQV